MGIGEVVILECAREEGIEGMSSCIVAKGNCIDIEEGIFVLLYGYLADIKSKIVFNWQSQQKLLMFLVTFLLDLQHISEDRVHLPCYFKQTHCWTNGCDNFLHPIRYHHHFMEQSPQYPHQTLIYTQTAYPCPTASSKSEAEVIPDPSHQHR